jgi:hypothetical protein
MLLIFLTDCAAIRNISSIIRGKFLKFQINAIYHDTLLLKLSWYGITGKANNLIKSYLVDRYQRVEIKKHKLWSSDSFKMG